MQMVCRLVTNVKDNFLDGGDAQLGKGIMGEEVREMPR